MAEVVVFVGPSLDPARAAELLPSARLRPPVRLGDVCAAVLDGFDVIVVIDGFFEQVPTVWHKEILWALSKGIAVYGASSMGALRAAELAPFGMCGVGTIFERFLDGTYNDDDEVTIVHADDDELGYRPLSVAMASIREAFEQAVLDGICTTEDARTLVARSKARHYSERSWPLVLRDAEEAGLDKDRVGRLRTLFTTPEADAKARDAAAVLRRVRDDLAAGTLPAAAPFDFEPTYNFEKLLAIVRAERAEQAVQRRFGAPSAQVRAGLDDTNRPLLQFLVEREAKRLGLRPTTVSMADGAAAEASPEVVEEVRRLESFRAQLEGRHRQELAMFTESAYVAAGGTATGQPVAERMRSQESNRLDDGRVVR
ncbi:TfuA-like protein [Dactylosporangium sp. NPDC051541]|uniref:TfuA-like protein n=1 Tax=Dactylosporangium sp. NPDC051541 TaxID=3363977 RepID=UPI0037A388C2